MRIKKEKKNKILTGFDSKENKESVEPIEALETATDAVISDLPERKRKKYERQNWGNRPEHLRKPIGQMSSDEKSEYYRWKAEDTKQEEIQVKAYEESEIYALGCVILPMLCARLPNPLPPTNEELSGFARVVTPLANKYVSAFESKEELNVGLFALAFILPRAKRNLTEVQSQEYTG